MAEFRGHYFYRQTLLALFSCTCGRCCCRCYIYFYCVVVYFVISGQVAFRRFVCCERLINAMSATMAAAAALLMLMIVVYWLLDVDEVVPRIPCGQVDGPLFVRSICCSI